ncbi:hypothetical protein HXX76_012687 [Chlamydomonas incerta]|uniref:mannan endo-1,4-beta-mannosidase n=1 Tax=Chlamydomonas incerta TaxID=51695 RepID=A0A835SUA2_CHLIN|nr:hypothetical protein HXX76_012687 [Chlamydomonas incerta]|eukprot:KAG2426900.1 hypothetical protein HXX76_012687 [Chlamydomonas incerta]
MASVAGGERSEGARFTVGGAWAHVRDTIGMLDMYTYTPSLLATSFKTTFSGVVSLLMYAAFLFTVAYTSYFWLSTEYSLSESMTNHLEGVALVASPEPGNVNQQLLPKVGIRVTAFNSTTDKYTHYVTDIDPSWITVEPAWVSMCPNMTRQRAPISIQTNCSFDTPYKSGSYQDVMCFDYDATAAAVAANANLTTDFCGNDADLPAPRVMGTFHSDEYSYFQSVIRLNGSHPVAQLDRDGMRQVYIDGGVEVFLQFPYTGTNSLMSGTFPSQELMTWSRKMPLPSPGRRLRWEIVLRMRQVSSSNAYWSIPALDESAMDFVVVTNEVSLEAVPVQPVGDGTIDLARIFIKMDDVDFSTSLSPYTSVYGLIGDWGGYLSIILFAGLPAYYLNEYLFKRAVKRLISTGDIHFDEKIQKHREDVLRAKATRKLEEIKKMKSLHRRQATGLTDSSSEDGLNTSSGGGSSSGSGSCTPDAQAAAAGTTAERLFGTPLAVNKMVRFEFDSPPDACSSSARTTPADTTATAIQQQQLVAMAVGGPPDSACAAAAPAAHGAAEDIAGSVVVEYQGRVFADHNEDEDDYDDVVRHCTSECTSMFHMRQVVKLVQEKARFKDLWGGGVDHKHAEQAASGEGVQQPPQTPAASTTCAACWSLTGCCSGSCAAGGKMRSSVKSAGQRAKAAAAAAAAATAAAATAAASATVAAVTSTSCVGVQLRKDESASPEERVLIDYVQFDRGSVDIFFDWANKFGLKVIRLWAFNHRMPYQWAGYDETQFRGLDYIVDAAGRHNIRLILALGNTWTAYRSPQDYMRLAGVDPAGKDLLDFYSLEQVRHFYRDHISAITQRNNTYNAKRYKDDPAIMMYDAMNEPRCPGCVDKDSQAKVQGFLAEMTAHLKAVAPNQLAALGTEGYFLNSYEEWNSGAGVRCEGEDWATLAGMGSIDVTVVHAYERQMESVPPKWYRCDFDCYANFLIQFLSVHQRIAAGAKKPLIMEEYGLILPYNVYLDGPVVKPVPVPAPPAQPPAGVTPAGPVPTPAPASPAPAPPPEPSRTPIVANTETLTDFLRGPQRAACAEAAAKWWLPIWTSGWAYTVDVGALARRTAAYTVLGVLRDTAGALY